MTSTEWNAAIDAALAKVREQRAVFSSDAYATPQPIGGFMERFACNSIEVEIEALRKPDTPPTPATDEREAVARAVERLDIETNGFYCDPSAPISKWGYALADAALSALAPIRAAEILAAEAEALGYATRLAVSLHATHFAVTAPEWQPLPDLIGVLTQIDNITTGIAEAAEANERARIVAWLRDCKGGCGIDAIEAMGDAADQIERNEHGAGK